MSQAVYWLVRTGATGLVGPVIVVLLVRGSCHPGRAHPVRPAGTATLIELGGGRAAGWLRQLGSGPRPADAAGHAAPSASRSAPSASPPSLLVSTLATDYLIANALGLVSFSIWDFQRSRAAP